MKFTKAALAATLLATVAMPASAVTLSYGVTLTSDYISRGWTQTGNDAALQPWVEAESNGFYGGLWASNVSLGPDDIEVDLYGGYRWSVNETSFDLGYARYYYDSTGDAGGEIYFLVEQSIGEGTSLFGGMYIGHAGGVTLNDAHLGFSTTLYGSLTGSARIGITPGNIMYADMGLGYDVNDNVSLDARYYARTGGAGRFVASVGLSF
ncbi:MAG: TorF family putative porin [Rhodobacteraceae bacterium]|nr:TorF family putative porin [Paracoccaceae bacterium]